jgi:hypothetical protein
MKKPKKKKRSKKLKIHRHVKKAAMISLPVLAWLIPSPLII